MNLQESYSITSGPGGHSYNSHIKELAMLRRETQTLPHFLLSNGEMEYFFHLLSVCVAHDWYVVETRQIQK